MQFFQKLNELIELSNMANQLKVGDAFAVYALGDGTLYTTPGRIYKVNKHQHIINVARDSGLKAIACLTIRKLLK